MIDKIFQSTGFKKDKRPLFTINAVKDNKVSTVTEVFTIHGVNAENALMQYIENYAGSTSYDYYEIDGQRYTVSQVVKYEIKKVEQS